MIPIEDLKCHVGKKNALAIALVCLDRWTRRNQVAAVPFSQLHAEDLGSILGLASCPGVFTSSSTLLVFYEMRMQALNIPCVRSKVGCQISSERGSTRLSQLGQLSRLRRTVSDLCPGDVRGFPRSLILC